MITSEIEFFRLPWRLTKVSICLGDSLHPHHSRAYTHKRDVSQGFLHGFRSCWSGSHQISCLYSLIMCHLYLLTNGQLNILTSTHCSQPSDAAPGSAAAAAAAAAASKIPKRKFSSFFKSLVIELDKELYGPDNHLVEWHRTNTTQETDGFQVTIRLWLFCAFCSFWIWTFRFVYLLTPA